MNHASEALELTILMPCLNEAETLGRCIEKAKQFLAVSGIQGEVLVSDNGSTDGSIEIATRLGAQVVHAPTRGYGGALGHGIACARGKFTIMGDADDSYDFSSLAPFVERLRSGADLVVGNRFKGGIAPDAMPFLHRYLGNPVLSFLGRLFFKIPVGDFHCGLRGLQTETIRMLRLRTSGMEFASEMIVRAAVGGLSIAEVPTTLSKDGRSRPPHLRTWRDGWRHLRFLLMYSPRWLFFYPGIITTVLGALLVAALMPGPLTLPGGPTLDIHSLIVGCLLVLIGSQAIAFAFLARQYAAIHGLLPRKAVFDRLPLLRSLEETLLVAALLATTGSLGIGHSLYTWWVAGFGDLEYASLARNLVVSSAALALAVQVAFTGFLAAILSIKTEAR